jgi:alpha-ketoglutaric semialdehyde dehydrogenase
MNFFTARGTATKFEEATIAGVKQAFEAADAAFDEYRGLRPERRAVFLEAIAEEIEALGDELLSVASAETALPIAERLMGERGRTVNQLKLFAALIREGSWVSARIDRAIPDRKPVPKPDIRRMLIPIGPVGVFSASNFPLAFSVAGGDSASALAAGCPIVVKAHPAHPATSELTAAAITRAAMKTGMPRGVFSLLQSSRNEIAIEVVRHPLAKAIAFTGSLRAGRALFDAAAQRPDPIPVYAEMGSSNPVFLLPGALKERGETIAQGMTAAVNLGGGQFCTSPGLSFGIDDENLKRFSEKLSQLMSQAAAPTMLHAGIARSYDDGVRRWSNLEGVHTLRSAAVGDADKQQTRPALFVASLSTFKEHPELGEELFGPSTLVVRCDSPEDLSAVARRLDGHLTSSIHGTSEDLVQYAGLVSILEKKVGRLIFNGFPTGVEVCPSMQHGGPYPSTTDSRTTSVGTDAILRFARPVAYQNFPASSLPLELRNENSLGMWRMIDGQLSKDSL